MLARSRWRSRVTRVFLDVLDPITQGFSFSVPDKCNLTVTPSASCALCRCRFRSLSSSAASSADLRAIAAFIRFIPHVEASSRMR